MTPHPRLVARPRRAAVATLEGALVNLHLGQTPGFAIFEDRGSAWAFVEERPAPATGTGDARWRALAALLEDCSGVFVSGAGARPLEVLQAAGLEVFTVEGLIDDLLAAWGQGQSMGGYLRREVHACGDGCRGGGQGCG